MSAQPCGDSLADLGGRANANHIEPGGPCALDTSRGILNHERPPGTEPSGGEQVRFGRGFVFRHVATADECLEKWAQAGALERWLDFGPPARTDHCKLVSAQSLEELAAAREERKLASDQIAEPVPFAGIFVNQSLQLDRRCRDAAKLRQHQPVGDAYVVAGIIVPIEVDSIGRENVFPAAVVQRLAVGENAVEIEKDGVVARG